ncbi:MAG: hypothetical protein OEV99_15000 [Nitrospira sp.]|nr:hypothetical protein [Nitrospira sp.]MDH4371129.1 hypothetical protein [Nitrospira sp.]MDH5497789.1 hypothetical protein [Nitrospira sp.]MDH5727315.1 hypothetical protein [Nitrospira sp.]
MAHLQDLVGRSPCREFEECIKSNDKKELTGSAALSSYFTNGVDGVRFPCAMDFYGRYSENRSVGDCEAHHFKADWCGS